MKRRPRRGMAAALTALVLLAAAVVAGVVAVQLIANERPWLDYDRIAVTLHDTTWRNTWVLVAGGVAAFAGLVLLLAAVVPGRLVVSPLRGDPEAMTSGASRRSMRSTLRGAAAGVDGVQAAKVHTGRKRLTVVAHTNRTVTTGLDDAVRTAVEGRLDQIGPARRPAVRVRLHAVRAGAGGAS